MTPSIFTRRPSAESVRRERGLKAAAVVAAAAVVLGVAAPLAAASEARNSAAAGSGSVLQAAATNSSDLAFTATDVRDLIQRLKAAGGTSAADLAQFETYASHLEGKAASPRFGWSTIIRKLVVAGFRHGGTWLGKVLKHVSPKASRYASKYGNKIADTIDAVENWGEHALTLALVKAGLPYDVVPDCAIADA